MPQLGNWLELLKPITQRLLAAIVVIFDRYPARIALSGALLLVALVFFNSYIDRTKQYQEIIATTVRAETEDTPQRFKVLEAFIMSTISDNLSEQIRKATISREFSQGLEELHSSLAKPSASSPTGLFLSLPDYVKSPAALPSQNAILTDDANDGYLFFPANLLRSRWQENYETLFEESKRSTASATLLTAVSEDPAIADDIAITRELLPAMKQFTQVTLFERNPQLAQLAAEMRPVQIYYVTKNGLNRIVNNTAPEEQRVVYRNMFRSTTFFPSRPYFVEAFKQIPPGTLAGVTGAVEKSFYVSQPYLDIGGFGVVVTLARPVRYPDHSDGALCLDLVVPLENDVSFQLKQRLESFGSTAQSVECEIGFHGKIGCIPQQGSDVQFELKQTLEDRLNDSMKAGDLSTVVGNISILDDQTARAEVSQAGASDFLTYPLELVSGLNTRPITFAIPTSSPRAPAGSEALRANFMIASLNLERFQEITTLYGFVAIGLLVSFMSLLIFSFQGEIRKRRGYEEAFATVEDVLYGAPTPYCRLSHRDRIVDCNTAFCDLLGKPADQPTVSAMKGLTFESFVAPRSKPTYQRVQERRRSGNDVEPYTLYFRRDDGLEVEARVTSGVKPGRSAKDLPETFGIVIPAPNYPARYDQGLPGASIERMV